MVVGVAVVAFGFFDSGRDGIGFNAFMPPDQPSKKAQSAAHSGDASAEGSPKDTLLDGGADASPSPQETHAPRATADAPQANAAASSSLKEKITAKVVVQTGNWASQVGLRQPVGFGSAQGNMLPRMRWEVRNERSQPAAASGHAPSI